ncbi:hypothetical protein A2U01_0115674, partial [Trifolium medium]|nr:hypothetical protein [Trifolium medium]
GWLARGFGSVLAVDLFANA